MTEALDLSADLHPGEAAPFGESGPELLHVITRRKVASDQEQLESTELRAYKLGKKRWLYNECRLAIQSESGNLMCHVSEASRQGEDTIPEALQDCGVTYIVKLKGDLRIDLEVYVVYDEPSQVEGLLDPQACMLNLQAGLPPNAAGYKWPPVHRSDCQKGCDGPILRSIQRYGRISRRTNKKSSPETQAEHPEDRAKDPRHLYLSIDEASTHVGSRRFRLIAAAYDPDRKLLGSCCSLPINVLANNDAPNGPAFIDLNLPLKDSWEGWSSAAGAKLSDEQQLRDTSTESLQREHYPGAPLESGEPSSSFHAGSGWYSSLSHSSQPKPESSLQFIRSLAFRGGDADELQPSFEESLPPAKRGRPSYGLDADIPLPNFFPGPDAQMSHLSSSMHSYLGPERLRLDTMAGSHSSMESTQIPLHDPLEVQALRHNSITDSSGLRHSSLPDLSVMRSNSLGSPMDSGLRAHSSMGSHVRYNHSSLAGYGSPPQLLTELHAQRPPELRDSFFWTHLQGQQGLATQSSAMRHESSPASLLRMASPTESFPWSSGSAVEQPRVQHVQNPAASMSDPAAHLGSLRNPFAQPGGVSPRDDHFWGAQVQQTARSVTRPTPEQQLNRQQA